MNKNSPPHIKRFDTINKNPSCHSNMHHQMTTNFAKQTPRDLSKTLFVTNPYQNDYEYEKSKSFRVRVTIVNKTYRFKNQKHTTLPESLTLDKICSITQIGEQNVFDLKIDKNHNFIASGLIVHNS